MQGVNPEYVAKRSPVFEVPLDYYVKIEGGFVQNRVADERNRIIIEMINSMAHQFGLKTVAEFAEDAITANMLAEIGVVYAQDYYSSRPALPERCAGPMDCCHIPF